MKLQTNRGMWQLVFTVAGLMPANLGFAEIPNPIQRAGRLHGVCWSDGYHACQSSGIRPLADLPPAQNTPIAVSHHFPRSATSHGRGPTFYDRFDAINHSRCDSAGCETPECKGCDSAWPTEMTGSAADIPMLPTAISPSIVIELPSFTGPPKAEFVPPAPVHSSIESSTEPSDDPLPETQSTKPVNQTAKPEPPAEKASSHAPQWASPLAAASRQDLRPTRPAPPDSEKAKNLAPANTAHANTGQQGSGQHTVRSSTPAAIVPVHPTPLSTAAMQFNPPAMQINPAAMLNDDSPTRTLVETPVPSTGNPTRLGHPNSQPVPLAAATRNRPQRLGSATTEVSSEISDMEELFGPGDGFFSPPQPKSNPSTAFETDKNSVGQSH